MRRPACGDGLPRAHYPGRVAHGGVPPVPRLLPRPAGRQAPPAARGRAAPSRLPSGWTPLELLNHLTFVELRWLDWGFEGRPFDDAWGDERDGRWHVAPDETLDSLLDALARRAERSRAIIERHDLGETGKPGERWDGEPPATLERVLFHLLQEYARHVGHLDIVCELAGTATGE